MSGTETDTGTALGVSRCPAPRDGLMTHRGRAG